MSNRPIINVPLMSLTNAQSAFAIFEANLFVNNK